jgi:hypothetical protein
MDPMSTDPVNPEFDSLTFPYEDGLSENGKTARARRGRTVGAATSELATIADAIEELHGRLAQARQQVAKAATDDPTEYEIDRIISEVQQFSEACLSKLEIQIRGILFEAEAKAAEILREADEEAAEIIRRAQQATSLP